MTDIEYRGLTIRQPWADAIVHGTKRIENRTWWVSTLPMHLLLHAAAGVDRAAVLPIGEYVPGDRVTGAILGVATLTEVHDPDWCSPWGEPDALHWVLDDVHALPEPVPYKGSLGLWRPTPELLTSVTAQLAREA